MSLSPPPASPIDGPNWRRSHPACSPCRGCPATSTTSQGSDFWPVTCEPSEDRAESGLMTSLAELAREHSTLHRDDIDHLHRLAAEWAFLADLCFADLILYVASEPGRWLIIDQVRPATNQTMYVTDYVGTWADGDEAALIEQA